MKFYGNNLHYHYMKQYSNFYAAFATTNCNKIELKIEVKILPYIRISQILIFIIKQP